MIRGLSPIYQSLVASIFTWGVTALGAALVFVLPRNSKKFLDISLGFAAGVMTAASFWSLLAPAIEISEAQFKQYAFVPVSIGFGLGAFFVHIADRLLPSCVSAEVNIVQILTDKIATHESDISLNKPNDHGVMNNLSLEANSDRIPSNSTSSRTAVEQTESLLLSQERELRELSWRRILLMIMAVTVHNIPEGMAVGVGFGSIGKSHAATFDSAFNLALGIGLQNFPEGLAVSLPLVAFGYSKFKAFLFGQFSGMVEPISAVLGCYLTIIMEPILPYALSFAAGAMIFVVVDDIIPEAQHSGNGRIASISTICGFILMMSLDVGLG